MADKSTYLRGALIAHVLGGPSYTRPAVVYISLHTASPLPTGGSEVASSNGYARAALVNDTVQWVASGTTARTNANTIVFPTPTGSWGTVTHIAVWDAPTGGNLLYGGPLPSSTAIATGDQVQIVPNTLIVQES
jgi:hypothetical protein